MEKIWQHVYTDELIASPEDHPLLLTEAPLNPYSHRQTAAQILFETFNVPAIFVGIQAVLALYASGRTTGVVLDSGDGVSHSVPVFEGFAIRNGIKRLDLGGRDVTRYLHHNLLRSGYSFTTSAEFDVVRQIKEKCCYVSLNPTREEKEYLGMGLATPQDEYVLPDGRTISLSTERFRAPEILFRPDLIGEEIPSLPTMLTDTIDKTDIDLRRSLYSNIVLSGGSTLLKGFGDRLLSEVKKNAMRDVKIRIYAPPERKYSTWIGGSILASLSTFSKFKIVNMFCVCSSLFIYFVFAIYSTFNPLILSIPSRKTLGNI